MGYIDQFRQETASLHKKLDQSINQYSIQSSFGYRRFLTIHAAIIPSVEVWLQSQPDFKTMPDWEHRPRARALFDDMTKLGIKNSPAANMSFLNDTSSVFGICYVLEGSRLGSSYLKSLVKSSVSSNATSFLDHGQGSPYWKTYLAWLEQKDYSASVAERAAEDAKNLFQAYLDISEVADLNEQ